MSSSYSSLNWVCLTRPISLCVDLFVYFLFIQHMCYLTVTRRGGSDGIEALSWRPYIPSLLWHCWLGHLTRRRSPAVPIKTKICVISHLADVITYAKFQVDISRGYDFTGGGGSKFPFSYWILRGPYNSAALLRCAVCDVFGGTLNLTQPVYEILAKLDNLYDIPLTGGGEGALGGLGD